MQAKVTDAAGRRFAALTLILLHCFQSLFVLTPVWCGFQAEFVFVVACILQSGSPGTGLSITEGGTRQGVQGQCETAWGARHSAPWSCAGTVSVAACCSSPFLACVTVARCLYGSPSADRQELTTITNVGELTHYLHSLQQLCPPCLNSQACRLAPSQLTCMTAMIITSHDRVTLTVTVKHC